MPRSKFIKRLGKHDQIVERFKSAAGRPKWISDEQWEALPQSLILRELRFVLARKGQRTRVVTIATTLLDRALHPKAKIAQLYGVRCHAESRIPRPKTTL